MRTVAFVGDFRLGNFKVLEISNSLSVIAYNRQLECLCNDTYGWLDLEEMHLLTYPFCNGCDYCLRAEY